MYKIHQLFKFRPKHSKKIWQQKTVAITYFGGADGTQTHDLYDANVALYQLSYNPDSGADKKTRTSKALLPLVPETSASTNSAISARDWTILY